jgi:hypothetical protein
VVPIFQKIIPPHFLALYNAVKFLQITHATMNFQNSFAAYLQAPEKRGTKYVLFLDHLRQTTYTEVD